MDRSLQTCNSCGEQRMLQSYLYYPGSQKLLGECCTTCRRKGKRDHPRVRSHTPWPNEAKDRLRLEFSIVYGGKCHCCGEARPEFLTVEHLDNSGKKHRKQVGSGAAVLRDLRRRGWPGHNIAIACMNCNMGRERTEDKVCPHEKERQLAERA